MPYHFLKFTTPRIWNCFAIERKKCWKKIALKLSSFHVSSVADRELSVDKFQSHFLKIKIIKKRTFLFFFHFAPLGNVEISGACFPVVRFENHLNVHFWEKKYVKSRTCATVNTSKGECEYFPFLLCSSVGGKHVCFIMLL